MAKGDLTSLWLNSSVIGFYVTVLEPLMWLIALFVTTVGNKILLRTEVIYEEVSERSMERSY